MERVPLAFNLFFDEVNHEMARSTFEDAADGLNFSVRGFFISLSNELGLLGGKVLRVFSRPGDPIMPFK